MKSIMFFILCLTMTACGTSQNELQVDCIEMSDSTQCEVIKREVKPCIMKGCKF
jgi:hypothetical protein